MTPTDSPHSSAGEPPARRSGRQLHEVRYSLPDLLAELEQERNAGSFSMEKLNQAEIGKMFENKRKRRVKKA
jgi:hypothetical protein